MNFWKELYDTYENNLSTVGQTEQRGEQVYMLLPVAHTTQTAHMTVYVTPEGEFHSAEIIDKGKGNTTIPTTEQSSSRSGSVVAPYPLHDKLPYVAGDFEDFGGSYKGKSGYTTYIELLKGWAESEYATDRLKSLYTYLKKGTLIQDLAMEAQVLPLTEDKMVAWEWDSKTEKAPIYQVVTGDLAATFVRFTIYSPNEVVPRAWEDTELQNSFTNYYNGQSRKHDFCYVTGLFLPKAESHANKIRHAGDKTKLISAKTSNGFQNCGPFRKENEVVSISYDVSQKVHNALKWLIRRQGTPINDRTFLFWGVKNPETFSALEDTYSFAKYLGFEETIREGETMIEEANNISSAILGYRKRLPMAEKINILILDGTTGDKGRLAVLYYRSLNQEAYFERLEQWHTEFPWEYKYRNKGTGQSTIIIGAPSLKDIADMAYGPHANEKLIKGTIERLLPCVIDGKKIPYDIVRNLTARASNPVGMENWEWEKTLRVACGMINKKEGMNVALDKENMDRDYLFGRMLAIADVLERRALGKDEGRATNAIRYMNAFSQHPMRTWIVIQRALQPYQAKLGVKLTDLNRLLDEVGSSIAVNDFNNKPLSGKYLLGFYSQRRDLYTKKDTTNSTNSEERVSE